jgi:hypothetical protein
VPSLPGLKVPKLTGWPLVGILGIGLAAVALVYGSATGSLGDECTMTVQADQVSVRSTPSTSGQPVETLRRGTEVGAEKITDSGFRKLTGGERWVPAGSVAATSGSVC